MLLYLRNSKSLKTLLICRQVNNIVIKNNEVEFVANENVITEISNDSELKKPILDFLKTKNLRLKQNVSEQNYDKETELKKWLGEKLIIN